MSNNQHRPPIQKGVPIPAKRPNGGFWSPLFDNMEVGDSFFMPVDPNKLTQETSGRLRKTILTAALTYKRARPNNWTLTTTERTEGGFEGVRAWRVE
jgi:hypothetical protein